MRFKSGDVYSGEFKDGVFHGAGHLVYKNGDIFKGEFENGAKKGQGILTLALQQTEAAGDY